MKTDCIGVIAEFNPFHEGHEYLFREAKAYAGADAICVCMSGNFTQRGVPAVFDKRTRAEEAVKGGADLVLELPLVYAKASAGDFARGALEILKGIGCVTHLAFGSETGDLEGLMESARAMDACETAEGKAALKKYLDEGLSYPAALYRAAVQTQAQPGPNDILAVEYLRNINVVGDINEITPIAIKRSGAGHNESASAIREELMREDGGRIRDIEEKYFDLIRAAILTRSAEDLEAAAAAGEGLGNKLKKEVRYAFDREELVTRVISKRYTRGRIERLLSDILLDIRREDRDKRRPYLRVLAFSEKGKSLLRHVKDCELATLPFVDRISQAAEQNPELAYTLEKEILAGDIYNLICGNDLYKNCETVETIPRQIGLHF